MNRPHAASPVSALAHLRRTLFQAIRNIVVFGLLLAVLGAAITEAVGAVLTQAVPSLPTHIAAVAVGLLAGYATAVTIAFQALLTGVVQSMEWVVAEVERLVGGAVREAESVLHLPTEREAHASPVAAAAPRGAGASGAGGLSGGMIGGISDDA